MILVLYVHTYIMLILGLGGQSPNFVPFVLSVCILYVNGRQLGV
jgi:hypothetical protein